MYVDVEQHIHYNSLMKDNRKLIANTYNKKVCFCTNEFVKMRITLFQSLSHISLN